jgi:hypothetical protein
MAATDGASKFRSTLTFSVRRRNTGGDSDAKRSSILTAPRAAAETTPFSCFAQLISYEDPTRLTLQPFVLRAKGKIVISGEIPEVETHAGNMHNGRLTSFPRDVMQFFRNLHLIMLIFPILLLAVS